ncbi:hypothetical protein HYU23_04175 [Candidatus Woesearchaeota archaeon]|nr:hypothetical protein [Candidatus Woesearchaeota archaeon]
MATDIVELKASFSAKRERLEDGLVAAMNEVLLSRTGLAPIDVKFSNERTYNVTLTGLRDGRPSKDLKYLGRSNESIDEAVKAAITGKVVDYDPVIEATLDRKAEAPYFHVPVIVRSLDEGRLEGYVKAAVAQLVTKYAARVKQTPDGFEYRVLYLKDAYTKDDKIPAGSLSNVVTSAVSSSSMADARKKVGNPSKTVRTKVYQLKASVMVYGTEEVAQSAATPSSLRSSASSATPAAASSSRSPSSSRGYGRGGPSAATEPASFTKATTLI